MASSAAQPSIGPPQPPSQNNLATAPSPTDVPLPNSRSVSVLADGKQVVKDEESCHEQFSRDGNQTETIVAGPTSISTEQTRVKRSYRRKALFGLKWFITDQYFLVGFGFIILITSQAQVPASSQQLKETVTTYLCVSLIFLITGCTIPTQILLQNASQWKIHIFVQTQSYLMTSAIVYAVVSLCATNTQFMDGALLVGMIIMGCIPTTLSSNIIMTRKANGNTALTTVQSSLGNLLGPFLSPILIQMYVSSEAWYTRSIPHISPGGSGGYGELYRRVFKQLGLSIFLPLAVGQTLQNLFPVKTKLVLSTWKVGKLSGIALLAIIWQTYDGIFSSHAFTSVPPSNMIFICFISIAFYLTWTATCVALSLIWRLNKKDVVAIAYCVPAKSIAIALPISIVMVPGLSRETQSKLQIPIVIFQGLQIAAGSLLTPVMRAWIRRNSKPGPEEERDGRQ